MAPCCRPLVVATLLLVAATLAAHQERAPGPTSRPPAPLPAPTTPLQIADAAPAFVVMPAGSPVELSGLTWAGGDLFYAVSDNDPSIHPFAIDIDEADGHVRGVSRRASFRLFDDGGRVSRGSDLEGVAFDPDGSTLTVVDEEGLWHPRRSLLVYGTSDRRQVNAVDLGGTYFDERRVREGLGLESVARHGATIWTANEEALVGDGPRSGREQGTLVRLTRFDHGRLTGQWAYRTAPTEGAVPFFGLHAGGVVELAVLADERLLVLERTTADRRGRDDLGGFVSRIYLADTSGATNVMDTPQLATAGATDVRLVAKQLLWSRLFPLVDGPTNFEGMALGPTLADGSRSLLLVSDNGDVPSALWALRLFGGTPDNPTD